MSPLAPALDRFENEAAIIGRLLTGYSAIEYQLCLCAGMGGGDVAKVIVALFIKRGETRRVHCAEALGQTAYDVAGLGDEYASGITKTLDCVKIGISMHIASGTMTDLAVSLLPTWRTSPRRPAPVLIQEI